MFVADCTLFVFVLGLMYVMLRWYCWSGNVCLVVSGACYLCLACAVAWQVFGNARARFERGGSPEREALKPLLAMIQAS